MADAGRRPDPDELRRAVASVESRPSATEDLPPLAPAAHEAARAGLTLLRYRPRSRHELRERLFAKEFPPEAVEEALTRLAVWGLLDDADFAREWVRGRRRRRGRSAGALGRELREKGVSEAHIADALSDISAEDERARARELVQGRLQRSPARLPEGPRGPAADRERRRLVAYLERRGYPSGLALSVVDEALAGAG